MWDLISEETKEELNLQVEHDGEFWLSFDDFITHFDHVGMAHLTPDTLAAVMFNRNRRILLDRERIKWGEKIFKG